MFLKERVAIVTAGGGPGMGSAFSHALAKEGAAVVVADYDEGRSQSVAKAIRDKGGKAIGVATDVSKPADVERMVERTLKEFGKVSILSNHAGATTSGKTVEEMPIELWDRAMNVHLRGTFLCTKAVIPHMRKEKWGRIVNTSSRAAYSSKIKTLSDYAAAKAAIIGFSRSVARELGEYGITVNCIAPGLVSDSGLGLVYPSAVWPPPSKDAEQTAADNEGQLIRPYRMARPDELAGALLYLVGPYSDRVTGMVMHVNGGSYLPA